MMKFAIQTTQEFYVTYVVEAETEEEAWFKLMHEDLADCDDQVPGEIIGEKAEAGFEVIP